jgi:hypothetical protein
MSEPQFCIPEKTALGPACHIRDSDGVVNALAPISAYVINLPWNYVRSSRFIFNWKLYVTVIMKNETGWKYDRKL